MALPQLGAPLPPVAALAQLESIGPAGRFAAARFRPNLLIRAAPAAVGVVFPAVAGIYARVLGARIASARHTSVSR